MRGEGGTSIVICDERNSKSLGSFPLCSAFLTTIYNKCPYGGVLYSFDTGASKKTLTQMDPGFIVNTTSPDRFAFTLKMYHDTNLPTPDSRVQFNR